MAMKARAARGVLWSLVEYGGGEGMSFVVFLVLARLVAPADFGLIALAGVYIAFVQTFLVQGFADAVIQRAEITEDHCTTAFWVNVSIAAVFLALGIAVARPVSRLFGQPELAGIMCWLAPVFLSTALNSIHQALFKRQLHFASFALRALAGIAAGGIVGIGMAVQGWGVWSLVGQQLANGIVSVAVIWGTSDWRPGWRPSRRSFAELAPFSWHVIAGALVRFFYLKCDVFLIGLLLDARQLGYYTIVIRLLVTCGLVTQSAVLPIVLPVLSRLQHDGARFRDAFATAVRLTQALYLPLAVGLGVVADPLVPLLFGRQWIPSIPLFEIMSLVGFFQLFSYFTAPALVALGKPEAVLRLGLVQFGAIPLLFVPAALGWGVMGVAAAFTAEFLVITPFHGVALKRLAGIDLGGVIVQCRASLGAGSAMAAVVLLLKAKLIGTLAAPALLASLIGAGAAVYLAVFAALGWRELREIADFAESALGRRPAAAS